MALLRGEQLAQVGRGGPVAVGVEQPREQLLGGLARVELDQLLHLLAGQQQPRLQLEQRGDQHEELGRGLEIELAAALEVVDVGDHDLGEVDLEQVDLLAQDQRQQQVERAGEHVEVELEVDDPHRDAGYWRARTGPTPIASRTSSSVSEAIARAFSAPSARVRSSAGSSARSSW